MAKHGRKALLLTLGTAALGGGLLIWPQAAAEGARQGLSACGSILIPALFPFLALSVFAASTTAADLLEGPVGAAARLLYGAPKKLAPAVLLSWIGGYPAGAKAMSQLLERDRITPEDAELALCFCVNSGPAFLSGVVGAGIFGSPAVGMGLFGCQLAAGVITGRLLLWGKTFSCAAQEKVQTRRGLPLAEALVRSVTGAASSMVAMCAFVVIFSAAAGVLRAAGLLMWGAEALSTATGGWLTPQGGECLLTGMLEVCGGSAAAAALPLRQAALVLPFMLSFGSLSVIFQVLSCFPAGRIKAGPFLWSRLLHGLLTEALAAPWLWMRAGTAEAFASGSAVLAEDSHAVAGSLCLLGMCAILFLTIEGTASGREVPRKKR